MSDICPFCELPIKKDDKAVACLDCGSPHHKVCWDKNRECAAPDCSGLYYERHDPALNLCSSCHAILEDSHAFCSRCGLIRDVPTEGSDTSTNTPAQSVPRFRQSAFRHAPSRKSVLLGLIGLAIVIIAFVAITVLTRASQDFKKLCPEYAGKLWFQIAADGSYLEVDTNWLDVDDYHDRDAHAAIKHINEKLGFTSSVFRKMEQTRSLDGRITESNDKYSVSWTYHPNKGLEVMYEKRK